MAYGRDILCFGKATSGPGLGRVVGSISNYTATRNPWDFFHAVPTRDTVLDLHVVVVHGRFGSLSVVHKDHNNVAHRARGGHGCTIF